ncbi:unnamed protein product [Ectocarpus sp. 13 AM-2016]
MHPEEKALHYLSCIINHVEEELYKVYVRAEEFRGRGALVPQ